MSKRLVALVRLADLAGIGLLCAAFYLDWHIAVAAAAVVCFMAADWAEKRA